VAGEILSQTSAKFTWTDNSDDETRFFVIGRPEDLDISWGVLAIAGPNATEATATSLEAGALYSVYVSAENDHGYSEPRTSQQDLSEAPEPPDPPDPPAAPSESYGRIWCTGGV